MYPSSLLTLVLPALMALIPMLSGCSDECGCDDRYDECVKSAPPGASRAECAREHDECEKACSEQPRRDAALQRRSGDSLARIRRPASTPTGSRAR